MDDFSSLGMGLGLKPQGKAAPMSRPSIFASSNAGYRPMLFDDVFGGPPKYTAGESTSSFSDFDYNNKNSQNHNSYRNYSNSSSSNIFDGLGISASSRVSYDENNYATMSNNKENRNYSVDKSASSRVNYDENLYYNVDKSASSRVGYDDNVFATLLNEKENRNYNVDKSASYRVSYNENVFSKMSNRKENGSYGVDKLASSKVSYGKNVFATKSSDRENRNYSVDESSSSKFSYDENVFVTMLNRNLNRNKSVEELGSSRVSNGENVFATVSNGNRDHSFDELDSSRVSYKENVFATMENDKRENDSVGLDEHLENLGRNERVESSSNNGAEGIDDLLPGFGVTSPQRSSRAESEFSRSKQTSINSTKPTSFVVFESTSPRENQSPNGFPDPLDEISNLGNSTKKTDKNSFNGDVKFDDTDPLASFGKSASVSSEINREGSPSRAELSYCSDDNFQELHETIFEMPSISTDSSKIDDSMASPSYVNVEFNERDSHAEIPSDSDVHIDSADDAWLRVYEIPLFTQLTSAPPPSRRPPSVPGRPSKSETESYYSNARTDKTVFYSQSSTVKSNMASPVDELPVDELENFAMGGTKHIHSSEEVDTNSSTCPAAMKEATDIAEARLRQTKEVTERENANTARNGENVQVKNNEPERENSENEERLESELRQREEEECMRLERERERAREEREARQAVERATREARERAAIEARKKSKREVVLRVQAEARRRAAEIAKEKAEKEAKERADAEIREKAAANARAEAEARRIAERTAVDRAAAEARERAANAARINQQNNENVRLNQQNNENVRMNQRSNENVRMSQQQRNENDLESFFSTNSRPSSAPRPMNSAVDPVFQSRVGSEPDNRTSSFNTTSNVRNISSATNLFGDLSSIFGGTVSSGDFQEVDGETEERRRTRLDRHQQTQERVAKALAEKNERDLQSERDQEERHKIAEKLDKGIRDWASGKEGNLRALLSTMQYVLWPECGWTPVSLTYLITGASVKKVYRKATLCIHPDKVQQKGANLQQKYIAEKVFNLLKEAWNKFNSEELF